MKNHIILCFLILFYFSQNAKSQEFIMDTVRLNSEIMGEERTLLIHDPPGLSGRQKVNVLLLLDGENSAYWLNNSASKAELNRLVVVGIVNTDRRRDLLAFYGAADFLRFLETEVLIFLNDRYAVDRRLIFGHSFGGSTVLYCLSEQEMLFDFYIASSPKPFQAREDCNSFSCRNITLKDKKMLYLGYGERDHRTVIRSMSNLQENLERCALPCLEWRFESFPGGTHTSSAQLTLDKALKYYRLND